MRSNFGIDISLPNAPGYQLCILGTEVNDNYRSDDAAPSISAISC